MRGRSRPFARSEGGRCGFRLRQVAPIRSGMAAAVLRESVAAASDDRLRAISALKRGEQQFGRLRR